MLRYYESQGLLSPAARSAAGYRLYAPETAQTLLFIQRAQRLGFSLNDIQGLLERLKRDDLLDETVLAVAEERYLAIERQLTELLVLRHEMGVFLLDFKARAGHQDGEAEDLYTQLVERVCGHDHGGSPPRSTLARLLERTGCALGQIEPAELAAALEGKHIHVWRDGASYRVLIPGHDGKLEKALRAIALIEADCHAHPAPQLERTDEGFVFVAEGEKAFLFAQFFLGLEEHDVSRRKEADNGPG
jgi:DNA-binding transcriptional MerR regulator